VPFGSANNTQIPTILQIYADKKYLTWTWFRAGKFTLTFFPEFDE